MAFGMQLSQRLTQSLVLAPQLQQSLALLQAPTLELKALVEQELQQNPVLEEVDAPVTEASENLADNEDETASAPDAAEPPEDVKFDSATEKTTEATDNFQAEFERMVQLDQEWRDRFSPVNSPIRVTSEDEERRQFLFDSLTAETSLAQHLIAQVCDTNLNDELRRIVELLIGNLDEYGYFRPWFAETIRLTVRSRDNPKSKDPEIEYFNPDQPALHEYASAKWPDRDFKVDIEKFIRFFESKEVAEEYARGKHWAEGNYQIKSSIEDLAQKEGVPAETVLQLLKVVQSFDPPGVGARDLRECLMLQLERAGRQETLEYFILRDFMDALGKRRIPEIARGTSRNIEDVQAALARIAQLEPRPGRHFLNVVEQYVAPEVFIKRVGDDYTVTTNDEQVPHLRISNVYKDLMSRNGDNTEVRNYIREKIRTGKFFIKSLQQRQQTIASIGREIVKRQREFLEKGVTHLKPMTMAQIAEVVGVHETTVSRAVSGKYIETPQGMFEMKYFFTAALQTASGTDVSNATVKDMVAEIFKKEDPAKPLSDQEAVKMLTDKGIRIARRTIAKYRDELGILPSNLRKVY